MGVWDRVDELIAAGQGWCITLSLAQKVKLPRRRNWSQRRKEWRGKTFVTSHSGKGQLIGTRPRCWAYGCHRCLRKQQLLVCSDECREKVLGYARKVVGILDLELVDRLDEYDPDRHTALICQALGYIKERLAHADPQSVADGRVNFATPAATADAQDVASTNN
jgi:hypothetical protein